MEPILAGIETEYGLLVEGAGAEDQIDLAEALVRSYPGERFSGWDYRFESPRSDLRGFMLSRLQTDPGDASFDKGKPGRDLDQSRADQVLANGARLYNDHGHPEYATPEAITAHEVALQDAAGELAVLTAASAFQEASARKVTLFKNNTDFHGASYGTHESYLVPRSLGFEALHSAMTPMLVARQVLCGAGKVGSESGARAGYQLSQRADFLTEEVSAETLFRRPVFNTRDEPHADPARWMRVHVICGDANMNWLVTRRKVALTKLALWLALAGKAPTWELAGASASFSRVSKGQEAGFPLQLAGGALCSAGEVLESYFKAAESAFDLGAGEPWGERPEDEMSSVIRESRSLLADLRDCPERFASQTDWGAKKSMLEAYMEEEQTDWGDDALRSLDLAYHNVDPSEGLFHALVEMGLAPPQPRPEERASLLAEGPRRTRAWARGLAISRWKEHVESVCWRTITFNTPQGPACMELLPDRAYPDSLSGASNVEEFIEMLRGVK